MAANTKFTVAVHTAAVLACHASEFVTSEYIACSVNTNPVVVRRVLCALAKAEIVECQKGKAGGARLKLKASKVRLFDIFNAVECDALFAIPNKPRNKKCPVSCCMQSAMQAVFTKVDTAVKQSLAQITLADIVTPITK